MKRFVSAELFKLHKRRMTWIVLAALPVVLAIVYAMLFATLAAKHAAGEDTGKLAAMLAFGNVVTFGDSTVFRVVAIMAVILAGATTAAEFQWRTIITLAAWSGDRSRLLIGRLAALGVWVGVLLAVGYATVIAGAAIGNSARSTFDSSDLGAWLAGDTLQAIARGWLLVMVYVSLAVMVAVLTRSAAAAVAIPLAVLLLEPFGVAGFEALGGPMAAAKDMTLTHNIDAVLAADGPIVGAGEDLGGYPSALRGAAFLVTFSLITGWIAVTSLAKRDIQQ